MRLLFSMMNQLRLSVGGWLLSGGTWDDGGSWSDSDVWEDS